MPRTVFHLIVSVICATVAGHGYSYGQMVTTAAPYHTTSSSFFENNSINWSLRGKNWFANSGGAPLPPFGGTAGGAAVAGGLWGGIGFAGGGVSGRLGFNFSQGSTRSFSSTTPSVTTMNGYPGSISTGVLQPFVTGITPVVGNYAAATSPLTQSQQAFRETGQQQISQLRQSQAKRYQGKLAQYLRRAEQGEASGNKRMARANYRLAISIAGEPLRSELQKRLTQMVNRTDQDDQD